MRKFLINFEVEKAFWVLPKNPDVTRVKVNKYEHIKMKLLPGNIS